MVLEGLKKAAALRSHAQRAECNVEHEGENIYKLQQMPDDEERALTIVADMSAKRQN